jgi:hypothetical protein
MTLQEQLSSLRRAALAITQSDLHDAIHSIASGRDDIVYGVKAEDGSTVVDTLEPYLPFYHILACEEGLLCEILQSLDNSSKCSKQLPSITALRECLNQLLSMASQKEKIGKVLCALNGADVRDYLQGNPLDLIENVANACVTYKLIRAQLDEIAMVMDERAEGHALLI